MTAVIDKLRGLVEALYLNTVHGVLDWKFPVDRALVQVDIDGYMVEVREEPGETFEDDIRVTVYSSAGDQVDTFKDTYFKGYTPVKVDFPSYYSVMSTTLEMARRHAGGADKALDSLLVSLGGAPIKDVPAPFSNETDDDLPF